MSDVNSLFFCYNQIILFTHRNLDTLCLEDNMMSKKLMQSIVRYLCILMLVGSFLFTATGCDALSKILPGASQTEADEDEDEDEDETEDTEEDEDEDEDETEDTEEDEDEDEDETEVSDEDETEATDEDETEATDEDETEATEEDEAEGSEDEYDMPVPAIEEQILVDESDIKITATGIKNDDYAGVSLKLNIENNSKKDVSINSSYLAVNNFMTYSYLYSEVKAGKKTNEVLSLGSYELKEIGIDNIGLIDLIFTVYDVENYGEIVYTDMLTIQTSDFSKMDDKADKIENAKQVFNKEGISVSFYQATSDDWGTSLYFLVENTGKQAISIACGDFAINDYMIDTYAGTNVLPGKKAVMQAFIYSDDLIENDIKDITAFAFVIDVYDLKTYDKIVSQEEVTVSVS